MAKNETKKNGAMQKSESGQLAPVQLKAPGPDMARITEGDFAPFWRDNVIGDAIECEIQGMANEALIAASKGKYGIITAITTQPTVVSRKTETGEKVEELVEAGTLVNINVREAIKAIVKYPRGTKLWLRISGKRDIPGGHTIYDYEKYAQVQAVDAAAADRAAEAFTNADPPMVS